MDVACHTVGFFCLFVVDFFFFSTFDSTEKLIKFNRNRKIQCYMSAKPC